MEDVVAVRKADYLQAIRVHHGTPQVYISIDIMPDYSRTTKLYGKMLPQSLPHTPDSLTTPNEISEVVKRLDCCTVCLGNEDPQFLTLAASIEEEDLTISPVRINSLMM